MRHKSRMISLRLSEEQYDRLRALHRLDGSRNVSAFVRDALQGLIAVPERDAKIEDIEETVKLLTESVEKLWRFVRPVEG